MRKILQGLLVAGITVICSANIQAQVAIDLQNKQKYQKDNAPGSISKKDTDKRDYYSSDSRYTNENGIELYEKRLKIEKKKIARIASRYEKK